jgi:putative DNA primase/helicase
MDDLDFWDRSADLFDSWTKFCKALGEEPGTSKSFASKFGRKGFEPHRTMKARGYKFIRVKVGLGNPWSD